MSERGTIKHLIDKWQPRRNWCDGLMKTEATQISLLVMQPAAVFLLAGIIVAAVSLLVEIIVHRRKKLK